MARSCGLSNPAAITVVQLESLCSGEIFVLAVHWRWSSDGAAAWAAVSAALAAIRPADRVKARLALL